MGGTARQAVPLIFSPNLPYIFMELARKTGKKRGEKKFFEKNKKK